MYLVNDERFPGAILEILPRHYLRILTTSCVGILGAFAEFRRVSISFVIFVCLSVRPSAWDNSAPTERIFIKFDVWVLSQIRRENSVFIKIGWSNGYLHDDQCTLWSYLSQFSLEWGIFQTKVVGKITPHILCSITFFFNCAVYDIMSKYVVEPGRLQMKIWRMRIACLHT